MSITESRRKIKKLVQQVMANEASISPSGTKRLQVIHHMTDNDEYWEWDEEEEEDEGEVEDEEEDEGEEEEEENLLDMLLGTVSDEEDDEEDYGNDW